MWIVYVVIATVSYSIYNGLYNGTQAGVGSMTTFMVLGAACYLAFKLSPRGQMTEKVRKRINDRLVKHKNSLFSNTGLNVLAFSLVYLMYSFSRALKKYNDYVEEFGFKNNMQHYAMISLVIGIVILLLFAYRYQKLPRSEKREQEYLNEETAKAYKAEIDAYMLEKRTNPELNKITYIKGHHLILKRNIKCNAKINGEVLYITDCETGTHLTSMHISNIKAISFQDLDTDSTNAQAMYDTFYVRIMYIDYVDDEGKNHSMQFNVSRKNKRDFENRIIEISELYDEPIEENNIDKPSDEQSDGPKDNSVESRLTRLKNLFKSQLITEEEYTNRKAEILKEV